MNDEQHKKPLPSSVVPIRKRWSQGLMVTFAPITIYTVLTAAVGQLGLFEWEEGILKYAGQIAVLLFMFLCIPLLTFEAAWLAIVRPLGTRYDIVDSSRTGSRNESEDGP